LRAFITTTLGPPQPRPKACNSPRRAATAKVEAMDSTLKAAERSPGSNRNVALNALTQIDEILCGK
jgi:hypothetical protein